MTLPPFSFSNTVTPATARQDHLQVNFGEWWFTGIPADFDGLRDRMASPRKEHRDLPDVMLSWGEIFKRPQLRHPLAVRKRAISIAGTEIPPPLFSGQWKWPHYGEPDFTDQYTLRTVLKLHLNPTRYVRCQQPSQMHGGYSGPLPEPTFLEREVAAEIDGERVLDGNDNWIPDIPMWRAFAGPERWNEHLRNYLEGVPVYFAQELSRINDSTCFVTSVCVESVTLVKAETYWEFTSDNPMPLIESLVPLLTSFAGGVTRSVAEHNSLTLSADIDAGRSIRIYAKTNRRVRVEVVHHLGSKGFKLAGGRRRQQWSELPGMLESLAEDAAALVNEMFVHFRREHALPSTHITPCHLMMEILHYVSDFCVATTILSALLHLGRVKAGRNGLAMQSALERLNTARILGFDPRTGNYRISPSRQHALRMLREHGNFSLLLPPRVRHRQQPPANSLPPRVRRRPESETVDAPPPVQQEPAQPPSALPARIRQRRQDTPSP